MARTEHIRVPKPVYDQATHIKDEGDYATIGEAVRHVFQEADYNV